MTATIPCTKLNDCFSSFDQRTLYFGTGMYQGTSPACVAAGLFQKSLDLLAELIRASNKPELGSGFTPVLYPSATTNSILVRLSWSVPSLGRVSVEERESLCVSSMMTFMREKVKLQTPNICCSVNVFTHNIKTM